MASTKVRGITIELSADASGVVNSLKDVNSSINSTQKELRDIEKLLKLDPTNVELLAQKQKALQTQVGNTQQKIDLLKKAEEDLKKEMVDGGTEEQQKQLAALDREIISAEQSLKKYTSQLDDAGKETKDLDAAQESAEKSTGKLSEGFTVMKGALANLVADGLRKAGEALKSMVTDGAQFADDILTLSSTTSIGADQLQKFSYMAGLVDVDVSTIAGSMRKLTKNMSSASEGTGAAYEAFNELGVSFTDINGNLRDNEDVFYDVIDALGSMENETERDALAMDLFGKSATELNPLIEAGTDQLEKFGQEAEDTGYVLSDDMLKSLGGLQDEFDRFNKRIEGVKNQIGAGLAPALTRAMTKINEFIAKVDWEAVGNKIGAAFEKITDVFIWLIDHGDAVISVVEGIGAAMIAIKVSEFMGIGGLISGIAAALIGGATALISWGAAEEEARIAAIPLIAATRELADEIATNQADVDALTSSYDAMNEARDNSLASIESEAALSEKLFGQLDGLVDANGEIAEGEEARAKVLLDQLNGALGTEYSITDGMITNYGELKQSVYDLIEAKKLEAQSAVWTNQLNEATQGLINSQRELEDISIQQAQANATLEEAQAALNAAYAEAREQDPSGIYVEFMPAVQDAKRAVEKAAAAVSKADQQYKTTEKTAQGFAYNSEQALNNLAAVTAGDMDAIETSSYETFLAMGGDSAVYAQTVNDNVKLATGHWQAAMSDQLSTVLGAQVEFRDAGKGTVDLYVNGQKLKEGLVKEEAAAIVSYGVEGMRSGKFGEAGKDAARGFANGLKDSTILQTIKNNAASMVDTAVTTAKARAMIASPSKVFMEMGEYVGEGFAIGIEDSTDLVERASKNMTDSAIKAARGLNMPGLTGQNSMTRYGVTANMQSREISGVLTLLKEYLPELASRDLVMDSGEVVGALAPKMSTKFGTLDTMTARGAI